MGAETSEHEYETLQLYQPAQKRKFKITIDHIYLIIAILAFIAAGLLAINQYSSIIE
jgi:hypothetical protein